MALKFGSDVIGYPTASSLGSGRISRADRGVRQQATAAEIGGKLAHVVADRLPITRAEAARRIEEAEYLGSATP